MILLAFIKKNNFLIIEWLAVILNLGFTVLFQQGNPWAFAMGVAGPLLLGYLSYQRKLFADVSLQLAYTILAIYGYYQFATIPALSESNLVHLIGIMMSLMIGLVLGILLKQKSHAALPIMDSLITTFSLWATLILMSEFQSAWLYFIFINLISIVLFYKRDLKVIALLYVLYSILAIQGFFKLV
jgi:nicotinamide mononucleotide transporter